MLAARPSSVETEPIASVPCSWGRTALCSEFIHLDSLSLWFERGCGIDRPFVNRSWIGELLFLICLLFVLPLRRTARCFWPLGPARLRLRLLPFSIILLAVFRDEVAGPVPKPCDSRLPLLEPLGLVATPCTWSQLAPHDNQEASAFPLGRNRRSIRVA